MEPASQTDGEARRPAADIPPVFNDPPPLPLRGQAAGDGPLLRQLHRRLRDRLPGLRLHGFAAPPTPAATDRLHLIGGLLCLPLMSLWPAGGLGAAALLTISMALNALAAAEGLRTGIRSRKPALRGFRIAPGEPGWNLLYAPDIRKVDRILFGSLDAPPDRRRWQLLAAGRLLCCPALLLCCLLPGTPELLWPAVGALTGLWGLLWALDRPPGVRAGSPQARTLAALLALCHRPPPRCWVLISGHSHAGLEAVLDWWDLEGRVELIQLDPYGLEPTSRTVPFPGARRFPVGEDPAAAARDLAGRLSDAAPEPA